MARMHLFLDTNIYLGFYKLSDDDLEELRKLSVTVRDGATNLLLTQQVSDEFERNREKAIADSLKLLDEAKLPKSFPRLFHNLAEYDALRDALRNYDAQRGALASRARADAAERKLRADELIRELWDRVEVMPRTEAIVEAARTRVQVGNPPGKGDSFGDAINWEILLASQPDGEELLFVSGDTDFRSPLDSGQLHGFLGAEWDLRKTSPISLYPSLSSLFKDHYPEIKLATELERELAVAKLVASGSFTSTHAAVRDLGQYTDFSDAQAQTLIEAANRNTQISWILGDADVKEFFGGLAARYENVLDAEEFKLLGENIRNAQMPDEGDEEIAVAPERPLGGV